MRFGYMTQTTQLQQNFLFELTQNDPILISQILQNAMANWAEVIMIFQCGQPHTEKMAFWFR